MDFLYNRRPSKPFRFTAKAAQWIKADFTTPQLITHASIFNHNFIESGLSGGSDIRLQANNADAWGAPAYNQALTWKLYSMYRHLSQTQRWWRLYVDDAGNTVYPQVGELILGQHAEFSNGWVQPEWGQGLNFTIAEAKTYFGQDWDYYLSHCQNFRLTIRNLNDPSTIDDVEQFFTDILGTAGRFVLIPNDALPFCFYVKAQAKDINYEQFVRGTRDLNDWSINLKTLTQGITLV
jgi:hypothetical protein